MKRFLLLLLLLLLLLVPLLLLLSACTGGQEVRVDTRLPPVDLSGLLPGEQLLGSSVEGLWVPPVSQNGSMYWLDGFSVSTDAAGIIQRMLWVYGQDAFPADALERLCDVEALLGDAHNDYWYDREQGLRAVTYRDQALGIGATFVYSIAEGQPLVWFVLSRL